MGHPPGEHSNTTILRSLEHSRIIYIWLSTSSSFDFHPLTLAPSFPNRERWLSSVPSDKIGEQMLKKESKTQRGKKQGAQSSGKQNELRDGNEESA
jgi:hypothetical protein